MAEVGAGDRSRQLSLLKDLPIEVAAPGRYLYEAGVPLVFSGELGVATGAGRERGIGFAEADMLELSSVLLIGPS